ncbi:hypothetical protein EDD98_6097 [Streptomyces sp. PanSC19]|uniref:SHOCT domain-containing protein n=1 Tax=Streptomyces sp. PanSC19 TaxID=1520455 RepID=UPI000F47A371|nr:SHOCT domain-containing protein [Streptomyces sp. PanSC19]ROQ26465.1 hypothetical protein EDD98_6097 [Streptomyces sp. PanSC19]
MGGAAYAAGRNSARAARREGDQEQAIADSRPGGSPRRPSAGAGPAPAVPTAPGRADRPRPRRPPPAAPTAAGGAPSITDQPARLSELVQQGLLTSEEFAAAKVKLLGI